MINRLPLLMFFLALLVGLSGCSPENQPTPVPTSSQAITQPTPATNPDLSNLIGEILKTPESFKGKTVDIVGYFRGWDLLDEAGVPPPVTRSDWVIADQSGAIYVTGSLPLGLDPASPDDEWTVIRLKATVTSQPNQVYLEAQSVELIPDP